MMFGFSIQSSSDNNERMTHTQSQNMKVNRETQMSKRKLTNSRRSQSTSEHDIHYQDDQFKYFSSDSKDRPRLVTTAHGKIIDSVPLNSKLTRVKSHVKFQNSAIELNREKKSSLYHKLTRRALKRVQTVNSLPRFTFTRKRSTRVMESLRSSSYNPFRDRMYVNPENLASKFKVLQNSNSKPRVSEELNESGKVYHYETQKMEHRQSRQGFSDHQ